MTAELGHLGLALALAVAAAQAVLPLLGAARRDGGLMAVGGAAAKLQFALVLLAFACLTNAFVQSDFSLAVVAQNSHSAKPLLYKVTGVWGNHEGSMLLWVLILALFGMLVALFGEELPDTLRARVLAVQGALGLGFLAFILFTSNPFARLDPVPADGRDLNPLLQDPGLAFHPPFLYLGYVGFSMAYAFAVAALIEGRVDAAWARWVRPWTLAAWCALTLGIAMGSWWAYYELGWGGWWFWDPVENASLMPWLAGTALLHSAVVAERRDALKRWTILLAIIAFALSLMGTFLVRSGVLTSVHAFASDPERGLFILLLLALAIGGALALYAWRAPALAPGGLFQPVSREGGLVLNNLLLSTVTATVFLGTLYPLFLDVVGGPKVSVGPPFYAATFVPLTLPLLVLAGIGPFLSWKRADLAGVAQRLKLAGLAAGLTALAVWSLAARAPLLSALGFAVAVFLLAAVAVEWGERIGLFRVPLRASLARAAGLPRAAHGMSLAHAGLALVLLGATADTLWKSEAIALLRPGETLSLAGHTLRFDGVRRVAVANYQADRATVTLLRGGEPAGLLTPERRFYPAAQSATTEAAIRTSILADLYVALGEPGEGGAWTLRAWHHPLVPFVWIGALVMAAGGLVSLSDRRLRLGVAARRPARAAA